MILSILPESETPLQKLVLKTSKIWILLKSINITKLKLPPTFIKDQPTAQTSFQPVRRTPLRDTEGITLSPSARCGIPTLALVLHVVFSPCAQCNLFLQVQSSTEDVPWGRHSAAPHFMIPGEVTHHWQSVQKSDVVLTDVSFALKI